jgi:hypothetical protein
VKTRYDDHRVGKLIAMSTVAHTNKIFSIAQVWGKLIILWQFLQRFGQRRTCHDAGVMRDFHF